MKKIERTLILLTGFVSIFFSAYAQKQDFYYSLVFKKDISAQYISADNFTKFIFNFEPTATGYYTLQGAAFDATGTMIGTPFTLTTVSIPRPRPLKNLFKGAIVLTLDNMAENGIDGTFDVYLVPKRFHEGKADEMMYVSYRVFNKPGKDNMILIKYNYKPFKVFDMNPSPPAYSMAVPAIFLIKKLSMANIPGGETGGRLTKSFGLVDVFAYI